MTNLQLATSEEQAMAAPRGIEYVEFYVGNARQTAHYLRSAFGFAPIAYAGLETGLRDRASLLMRQEAITLLLTEPLDPHGSIAEHVKLHGDGIKDIAFTVDNAALAFEQAVARGARPVLAPTVSEDEHSRIVKATVATFGKTVHSFIQRDTPEGNSLPLFKPARTAAPVDGVGFCEIDHLAVSLEAGSLLDWAAFYINVLGFHQSHQEDIQTEYSGMSSRVVQNRNGTIKFPMQEPVQGKRRSQIEEFLSFNHGAGVQHLALTTDDIIATIEALQHNGIEFVSTPPAYYDLLEERVGQIDEDVAKLRELSILVDRDSDGYLLQIFTKPIQSRPTLFFEIIQRKRAQGFGSGNIKALFAALEREQALRGNL